MGSGTSKTIESEIEYSNKLRHITETVRKKQNRKFRDECVKKRREHDTRIEKGIQSKIVEIKTLIDSGNLELVAKKGYAGKQIDSFFGTGEQYSICVGVTKLLPSYRGVKIVFHSDKNYDYHKLTLMW